MDNLYDYFLHYNIYTKEWNAVSRDKANQYLNGTLDKNEVIKYKNINDLIRYIQTLKK